MGKYFFLLLIIVSINAYDDGSGVNLAVSNENSSNAINPNYQISKRLRRDKDGNLELVRAMQRFSNDPSNEGKVVKNDLDELSQNPTDSKAREIFKKMSISKKACIKSLLIAAIGVVNGIIFSKYSASIIRSDLSSMTGTIDWFSIFKNGTFIAIGLTAVYLVTLLWQSIKRFFSDDVSSHLEKTQEYSERAYSKIQRVEKDVIELTEAHNAVTGLLTQIMPKVEEILEASEHVRQLDSAVLDLLTNHEERIYHAEEQLTHKAIAAQDLKRIKSKP